MITQERVLATLGRFKIDEYQLDEWEQALGLNIPLDESGNKVYSRLHINLFKNIKKHLILGRSIDEIKKLVILPDETQSTESTMLSQAEMAEMIQNVPTQPTSPMATKPLFSLPQQAKSSELPSITAPHTLRPLKRYASSPVKISSALMSQQQRPNTGLLVLVDKLMAEKDSLQQEITNLEKQKAHLYQTNELFKNKVEGLQSDVSDLQSQLKMQENLKLMNEKAQLQKQLLETEQRFSKVDKNLKQAEASVNHLQASLDSKIEPKVFIGNWLEEADLVEVAFDNFGINIDSHRSRLFKITHPPARNFGHTAIIETHYDYQTNTLWKRSETLIITIISESRLEGEMIAEYTLDGTPVAKALYKVKCQRQGGVRA